MVAHLLYRLLTGNGYVDFVAEREAAPRQIAGGAFAVLALGTARLAGGRSTARSGAGPLPEGRFASLDELAAGLEKCTIAGPPAAYLERPPCSRWRAGRMRW